MSLMICFHFSRLLVTLSNVRRSSVVFRCAGKDAMVAFFLPRFFDDMSLMFLRSFSIKIGSVVRGLLGMI